MPEIAIPTLYNQMDSRWANLLLGFNTDPHYNFYNYACLITCLAMSCKYYGKDVSPIDINTKLKEVKGYVAGGGNYIWGSITKIFSDIKEVKVDTPAALTDSQIGDIKTAIDNGYPVMVQIDVNPRTVTNDMHFVLIIGYNPSDENDFLIADPIGGTKKSLKSYLGWYKPSARNTIEKYIILTGPKPKITSNTVALSKDDADRRTHGNEQWIKLLNYLEIKTDPFLTLFEDAQKVIAGFKSRATDLENQLATTIQNLAMATKAAELSKQETANKEIECQTALKLKDTEIMALKQASPNIDKLRGEYEGVIKDLQGKLTEANKQLADKEIELTETKSKLEMAEKGTLQYGKFELIIKLLKEVLGIK